MTIIFAVALIMSISGTAQAVLTTVSYVNGPQDPLWVPALVDELGVLFPPDEQIASTFVPWLPYCPPCPANFEGTGAMVTVEITNLTGKSWTDLWYVADPETTLTNHDGWVNGQLAFKIDAIGANTPLIFESMAFNGIFEPGEKWEFVIQDYTNLNGLGAEQVWSGGVPSVDPESSGSIIAIGLVSWLHRRTTL